MAFSSLLWFLFFYLRCSEFFFFFLSSCVLFLSEKFLHIYCIFLHILFAVIEETIKLCKLVDMHCLCEFVSSTHL